MKRAALCLLAAAGSLLTACTDDVQDIYSDSQAFFRFDRVLTVPPLYTAVSNPGQFCTITFQSGQYYIFTDARGNATTVPLTAAEQYYKPVFISGFIVGTPSVTDLSGNFPLLAFDLVCPDCDTYTSITRRLSFSSETTMRCSAGHEYDLNNSGLPAGGGARQTLYRYRVYYNNTRQTLIIQN